MSYTTISLSPESTSKRREDLASAVITPGTILELAAGEVAPNSTATASVPKFIAVEKISTAGDLNTAYAIGETCFYKSFQESDLVLVRVVDAQVLTEGTLLTTTATGSLTAVGATLANAFAMSRQAITTSGVQLVKVELIK